MTEWKKLSNAEVKKLNSQLSGSFEKKVETLMLDKNKKCTHCGKKIPGTAFFFDNKFRCWCLKCEEYLFREAMKKSDRTKPPKRMFFCEHLERLGGNDRLKKKMTGFQKISLEGKHFMLCAKCNKTPEGRRLTLEEKCEVL